MLAESYTKTEINSSNYSNLLNLPPHSTTQPHTADVHCGYNNLDLTFIRSSNYSFISFSFMYVDLQTIEDKVCLHMTILTSCGRMFPAVSRDTPGAD